jgi:hypothetical protein
MSWTSFLVICDVFFQVNDRLLIGFDTINIGDLSVLTNKEDSHSGTIINYRDVGINNVASDCFISKDNIKRRVRGAEGTT